MKKASRSGFRCHHAALLEDPGVNSRDDEVVLVVAVLIDWHCLEEHLVLPSIFAIFLPMRYIMCITWSTEIYCSSGVPCFYRLRHFHRSLPKWRKKRLPGEYRQHNYEEFTATFHDLHITPQHICEEIEASLEYFTILLYYRTVTWTSINEARKLQFTHNGCQMPSLPLG